MTHDLDEVLIRPGDPVEPASESTARLAAACRPVVDGDVRVQGLYLFGSRARGEDRGASDVDLGVLFAEPVGLQDLVLLQQRIEAAVGKVLPGVDVDLVDLGRCGAFLALDAVRGERIYERDGAACDRFDLYVMARAGDLAPFERERRRRVLDPSTVGAVPPGDPR